MEIKATRERVWWDDTTDNKPSNSYFNTFKSSMTTGIVKNVNQVAMDRVHIVVPDNTITYISINHNNYTYYYYYNKIINILPNGYTLEFVLDIYTTYTLPYWESLRNNNTKIKFNRHKRFTYESILWEDEMLNKIPILYSRKIRGLTDIIKKEVLVNTSTNEKIKFNLPGGNWGNGAYYRTDKAGKGIAEGTITVFDKYYIPCVYAVFTEIDGIVSSTFATGNKFALFPILDSDVSYMYMNDRNVPGWWVTANKETSGEYKGLLKLHNYYSYLTNIMINNQNLANKFKGLYMGCSFANLSRYDFNIYKYTGSSGTDEYALFLEMDSDGVGCSGNLGNLPNFISLKQPSTFNQSDKLSIYAAKALDFMYYNHKIDFRTLVSFTDYNTTNSSVKMRLSQDYGNNDAVLCYTSCLFVVAKQTLYPINTNTYSFPGDLPLFIDSYTKYIQATKNTRDTGIDIAKQNLAMGLADGVLNYVGSIASSGAKAFTGDLAGALTDTIGASQSIMGMVKTGMGYQQKMRMMDAELADKRTTMTTTIQAGTVADAAVISYVSIAKPLVTDRNSPNWGDYIEYNDITSSTKRALNNVLYLYGVFHPIVDTIDNLTDSGVDFNYYKPDAEYMSNIFATTLRAANNVPVQREYYDEVFNSITQGLRMWNKKPVW